MKNFVKGLVAVSLFALPTANANAICLDYWLKGPSACKEDPEEKNRIYIKGGKNVNINIEKDDARIAYEEGLNKEIDKFLAGYGKPPREFVAFHLDPTMENAVRWVKKFNTEHERTMKIAVAWKQADRLFREYKATGEIILPADSGVTESQIKYLKKAFEEDATELPEVKGFGVNLPGDWDEDRMSRNYAKLDYKDEDYAKKTKELLAAGEKPDYELTPFDRRVKVKEERKEAEEAKEKATEEANKKALEEADKPSRDLLKSLTNSDSANSEKLEISYYFSKKCPFCDKYHSQLSAAVEAYGRENIELTCVDMTPGAKSAANIKGKINCKWRPLQTGEMAQFGVKRTPSILVKRGGSKALELLENYYDSDVLLKYFKNGPNAK